MKGLTHTLKKLRARWSQRGASEPDKSRSRRKRECGVAPIHVVPSLDHAPPLHVVLLLKARCVERLAMQVFPGDELGVKEVKKKGGTDNREDTLKASSGLCRRSKVSFLIPFGFLVHHAHIFHIQRPALRDLIGDGQSQE